MFVDRIPIADVSIDLVIRNLVGYDELYMCGNHGDPIYHPRFHDLLRGVREAYPDLRMQFETNGSGRTAQWWEDTADCLGKRDTVIFSVDGLRGTNHIYRIGSRWDSIETGMRTLRRRNSKVRMHWKWILFHHNQDQAREGYVLSRDIGFDKFTVVLSDRNRGDHWLNPTIGVEDIMGGDHG
jgi:hypothetical protein